MDLSSVISHCSGFKVEQLALTISPRKVQAGFQSVLRIPLLLIQISSSLHPPFPALKEESSKAASFNVGCIQEWQEKGVDKISYASASHGKKTSKLCQFSQNYGDFWQIHQALGRQHALWWRGMSLCHGKLTHVLPELLPLSAINRETSLPPSCQLPLSCFPPQTDACHSILYVHNLKAVPSTLSCEYVHTNLGSRLSAL